MLTAAGKPFAPVMPRRMGVLYLPCAAPASIAGPVARHGDPSGKTSVSMLMLTPPRPPAFARANAARRRGRARPNNWMRWLWPPALLNTSEQPLPLTQLAARIGLSASHLTRAFKARTGLTPKAWSEAQRRARLEQQLPTADSVLGAALSAGYSGTRALYQQSATLSPAQRRKQAAGEQLRYSIAPCPLGHLLLASSAKGICALLFGDDPAQLLGELQQRFAAAELHADNPGLGDSLRKVLAQISEPQRAAQLPLDIRGTVFQQQVWRALQQIPSGQTRNYAELAAQLGSHPRAVARACASNPLGLLVPCHRVISSNGSLSGYRWGLARKAALLKQEARPLLDQ